MRKLIDPVCVSADPGYGPVFRPDRTERGGGFLEERDFVGIRAFSTPDLSDQQSGLRLACSLDAAGLRKC